ncbi:hypothetical protein K7X08_027810 [Anisodus acutangulus]|uniref:Uncharacterized protein n=1 Tax=Anisodus acutangulus TaxID=402998 RepID=A0A9Q1LMW4_9SOLA|nr:hypothetical protein K7X08_027810 [Anisodus acutangulus]
MHSSNFIPTPNVGSCTGIHTSQHSSSSYVPATSTPSISGLRIEVPAAPSSPSIDSTTPATSQRQNVKETLEYDEYGRLIIIPDGEEEVSNEGFIPSCAGNMVTASFKPFMRDAWGRYKDIPYDVRLQMLDQFREGFHKSLEDWRQTQPASEDGTAVRPSPTDITSIWTEVAGGLSKGRVYGLGVLRSSSRPSPLLSNAFTSQNTEEMEAMRRQIAELKQKCKTSDAKLAKIEKFMMKHMPQGSDDEEETESDDN